MPLLRVALRLLLHHPLTSCHMVVSWYRVTTSPYHRSIHPLLQRRVRPSGRTRPPPCGPREGLPVLPYRKVAVVAVRVSMIVTIAAATLQDTKSLPADMAMVERTTIALLAQIGRMTTLERAVAAVIVPVNVNVTALVNGIETERGITAIETTLRDPHVTMAAVDEMSMSLHHHDERAAGEVVVAVNRRRISEHRETNEVEVDPRTERLVEVVVLVEESIECTYDIVDNEKSIQLLRVTLS